MDIQLGKGQKMQKYLNSPDPVETYPVGFSKERNPEAGPYPSPGTLIPAHLKPPPKFWVEGPHAARTKLL